MGLFSGDKKITNEHISNTHTENTGFSDLGDDAVAISGDGNSIVNTVTDFGAVEEAFELAGDVNAKSLDAVTEFSSDALDSVTSHYDANIKAVSDFGEEGFDFGRDVIAETLGQIRDSDELNHQLVEQALDYNQALVGEANRSESATAVNNITKFIPLALLTFGTLGGIWVLKK